MPRLFMLLLSISVGTLAGIGVIAALPLANVPPRELLSYLAPGVMVAVAVTGSSAFSAGKAKPPPCRS